jgi:hypothetical protein
MRLAPDEVREVIGFDKEKAEFRECIQSNPCMMIRKSGSEFVCPTHNTYFKPALDAKVNASALWPRILDGLKLFNIPESQLTGVTAFRLSMVQRPRFTAELLPPTTTSSGTFGCLLGDAANAIHFWPGRGLNSGFAAAHSLARNLATRWTGVLRDSDFMRHEAAMAMLQYRHKSRAWRAMISTDPYGKITPIQQVIGDSYRGSVVPDTYEEVFFQRLKEARDRLNGRLDDLPKDSDLKRTISRLAPQTLKALVESKPWDTPSMGGEEADVDMLWASMPPKQSLAPPVPKPSISQSEVDETASPTRHHRVRYFLAGGALTAAIIVVWQRGLTQAISDAITWAQSWFA